jgi:hypothetical protein
MTLPNKRIAYVLSSKFPTQKAYGVTARETVSELLLRSIDVKIFVMKSEYLDDDFKKINKYIINFSQNKLIKTLINFGEKRQSRLNYFSWRLGTLLCIIKNLQLIENFNPDLIWVRDPLLVYLCAKKIKSAKIIFEVHDSSSKYMYRIFQKYNSNIQYLPINESNKSFLVNINSKINTQIAPMGIRNISESVQVEINKYMNSLMNKKGKPIQIGYIGRFAPGGYTKGIEDLINYAKFSQAMNLNNEITLIGAIDSEIEDYNSLRISLGINSKYLKIRPHVSHSIAVRMMRSFDVLILPKYSSESYMGMPLKLLEYLSSGRITIIADIDLYTKCFTSSFKPFLYTPEDMLSLDYSLNSALKDKKLKAKLNAGVNFASNFTWQKRTSKILQPYGI